MRRIVCFNLFLLTLWKLPKAPCKNQDFSYKGISLFFLVLMNTFYSFLLFMKSQRKHFFPHVLLAIYVLVFILCAINPYERTVWRAENLPVMAVVLFLVITFRRWRFSNLSYVLMSFWILMHTIGGHYTFERVPFDWVNSLFSWERNMYDRIAHYIIGLYAYPIMEYLRETKEIQKRWVLYTFGISSILAIAGAYEIFEWRYAVSADPEAGIAVLGSQGDIRDAQKDMFMDTLGAISAVLIFAGITKSKKKLTPQKE